MWIKSDYDFGLPYCVFTLSAQELAASTLRDTLTDRSADPAAVEAMVMDLVRFYRPDLAQGGSVVSLAFRFHSWEIGFTHPSLPRIKDCAETRQGLTDGPGGELRQGEMWVPDVSGSPRTPPVDIETILANVSRDINKRWDNLEPKPAGNPFERAVTPQTSGCPAHQCRGVGCGICKAYRDRRVD